MFCILCYLSIDALHALHASHALHTLHALTHHVLKSKLPLILANICNSHTLNTVSCFAITSLKYNEELQEQGYHSEITFACYV